MMNGMMNAALNTGPMKPTDCASTSTSDSFFAPRRSYPSATGFAPSPLSWLSATTVPPLS